MFHPLTVNVDAYLLRCAHRRALAEDTSVNAVLQRFIADYATGDVIYRRAAQGGVRGGGELLVGTARRGGPGVGVGLAAVS